MSSMLTSQGLVLATAMAVSAGTLLLFDLFRDRSFPPPTSSVPANPDDDQKQQALKSCLSSGSKRKKKRVQFADDVKDTKGNGELYRRGHRKYCAEIQSNRCGNEVLGRRKMPANRAALYSGILRDRVQRMGCSY
ncbi:hypothetical protein Salat_1570400 [Sesamum alatum]|uniref:Uncharacterized protein n=1 Tax=Sesamum alatum TaxID=300844 RepID=A0AAE2CN56_9LAMI|nr:hypothetical protein Salat_1570400 [Sesamum alatum]